jgi:hypothetical protein
VPKVPSTSSHVLSSTEAEETQAGGLASKASSVPSCAINLRTYRLTDESSPFIISGRTTGMGYEMKALDEQVTGGRKQRCQWGQRSEWNVRRRPNRKGHALPSDRFCVK